MDCVASSFKTAAEATTTTAKVAAKATTSTVKTAAKVVAPSYHEYSWDELKEIEKRRRAILQRTEEPFWSILSHFDGTVLAILLQDSLLWITILIYIGVRIWARYGGIPEYVAELGTGNITGAL